MDDADESGGPTGPRYLIADDWTHLDVTEHEYDVRWVIDRRSEALVAAQYALADGQGWRPVTSEAHWADIAEHLGDNQLPEHYEAWGDALRLSDALPDWAPKET